MKSEEGFPAEDPSFVVADESSKLKLRDEWREFFDVAWPYLMKTALAQVQSGPIELAEDIVQEAIVSFLGKVRGNLLSIKDFENPHAYLNVVIRNKAKELMHAQNNRRVRLDDGIDVQSVGAKDEQINELEMEEERKGFEELALNKQHYGAEIATVYGLLRRGASISEIAKALKVGSRTVARRILELRRHYRNFRGS